MFRPALAKTIFHRCNNLLTTPLWTPTPLFSMMKVPSKKVRKTLMNRKAYLKDVYLQTPAKPFTGLDYVLCAIACLLSGIACVPEIATLIVAATK